MVYSYMLQRGDWRARLREASERMRSMERGELYYVYQLDNCIYVNIVYMYELLYCICMQLDIVKSFVFVYSISLSLYTKTKFNLCLYREKYKRELDRENFVFVYYKCIGQK